MADLRRDLQRGEDIPLMQVTHRRPRPVVPPDRRAQPVQRQRVELRRPRGPGQTSAPTARCPPARASTAELTRHEYDYERRRRLASSSPPGCRPGRDLPDHGRRATGATTSTTMDFLAGDDDLDTSGLNYTLTGVDLDLDGRAGRAPPVGAPVSRDFTDLPDRAPTRSQQPRLAGHRATSRPASRRRSRCSTGSARTGGFTYALDVDARQRHRRPACGS